MYYLSEQSIDQQVDLMKLMFKLCVADLFAFAFLKLKFQILFEAFSRLPLQSFFAKKDFHFNRG
jgi:hypothetical protein